MHLAFVLSQFEHVYETFTTVFAQNIFGFVVQYMAFKLLNSTTFKWTSFTVKRFLLVLYYVVDELSWIVVGVWTL